MFTATHNRSAHCQQNQGCAGSTGSGYQRLPRSRLYHGASNVSSDIIGVLAVIRRDAPKAVYMHCSGHCLNLVLAHSCALPIVRNTLDKMKSAVNFFITAQRGKVCWMRWQPKVDIPWGSGIHSSMYVTRDELLAMMHTATSTVPLPSLSKHWKSSPMTNTQRTTVQMSRQDGRENTG